MKIEIKLSPEDFLQFQLFTAAHSERIKKKKRNSWLIISVGFGILAVYFHFNQLRPLRDYFALVSIISALFYPKYFNWRYKKHYKEFIKENYTERINVPCEIEFSDDSIYSLDKSGESRINLSEVAQVDETTLHFFVKLRSSQTLIIPKSQLNDVNDLRARLIKIGLSVNDATNWKGDI